MALHECLISDRDQNKDKFGGGWTILQTDLVRVKPFSDNWIETKERTLDSRAAK